MLELRSRMVDALSKLSSAPEISMDGELFTLFVWSYLFVLGAESFIKDIGSQNGIVSDSRENSLYSALWVAQALLRKG